jgi:hypothetical protein
MEVHKRDAFRTDNNVNTLSGEDYLGKLFILIKYIILQKEMEFRPIIKLGEKDVAKMNKKDVDIDVMIVVNHIFHNLL